MSLDAAQPYRLAAAVLAAPYGPNPDPAHPYRLVALVLARRYRWGLGGQILGPDGEPIAAPGGDPLFEPVGPEP